MLSTKVDMGDEILHGYILSFPHLAATVFQVASTVGRVVGCSLKNYEGGS